MDQMKREYENLPDMDPVLCKTKELTTLICNTQEYCRYQDSLSRLKDQESLFARLGEYRKKAFFLTQGESRQEAAQALYEEYRDILSIPVVMDFLAWESRLNRMLRRVFDSIAEEIRVDISYLD